MNHLADQSSPYLLQHANNPVDWYPWGEEALQKAKDEDKLILVSIGYAACHWCHVMEHESFEDEEVAALMNQHFVCIKIDREERPDIDQVYMDAVMLMIGHGGWPLNCFTLPDGRPIAGGTYYPKEKWMDILTQLASLYHSERERVLEAGASVTSHLRQLDKVDAHTNEVPLTQGMVNTVCQHWVKQVDYQFGGRKQSRNKFPLPGNNLFLLRAAHFLSKTDTEIAPQVQAVADVTLSKMAFGGIYDHLGGGFSRYAVDPYWKVPHFEKMLYDNGQLVSLYAEAYQADPKDLYKRVVYDTLAFVERELTSPEGGFYASLDADSEGVEGKFYVWGYEEIQAILGKEAAQFAAYYNVQPNGNWEETNVLFVLEEEADYAKQWGLDAEAFSTQMARNRQQLFEARAQRIRPALDDKILTSWNALMLKGYVDAYRVFQDKHFLQIALTNAQFIADNLSENGKLWRNYKDGKRSINAFLDDYAYLIDAYLALYQVTFDEKWFQAVQAHLDYAMTHFSTKTNGLFYYTSDLDAALITRKTELTDDVTPASNSIMAHNLHTMGLLLGDSRYLGRAAEMLQHMAGQVQERPSWHAHWAMLLLRHAFPHYEVAITGEEALALRHQFEGDYAPNRLFAGAKSSSELPILQNRFTDQATIYVCEGHACQLPVHTVADAQVQMS